MKKFAASLLAVLLAVTSFSGCSKGSSSSSASSEASSASSASAGSSSSAAGYAKQINFFQWTEYTPQSVLDGFKKKYGITAKMTMYSNNEEMLAKLKAGGLSMYDVVVPSCFVVKSMIAQNLLDPLGKENIPNFGNIDKSVLGKDYDKDNQYTVPYMLSPCVLVVNTKKVTKTISSFNDLLDPSLKNQIVVVDDERPIFGVALAALGYSCNDTNADHLKQAQAWLAKFKPNIKVFDSDSPKTSLISGDCTVGYIYNGEAALALKSNPDLKVVWTKEGLSGLIIDNLAIVKGTKHKKEAQLFINYILDPGVSAQITAAYPYTNPNKAAHDKLGDAYLKNDAINIGWDKLKSASVIDDVGETLTQYDTIWSTFKS